MEDLRNILDGQTYSKCSVLASTKNCKMKNMFAVNLKLEGWNVDIVMEVIHKYFNHSPNKVLALKLKITSNEPFKHLLRCPLLAQLGRYIYDAVIKLKAYSYYLQLVWLMKTLESFQLPQVRLFIIS